MDKDHSLRENLLALTLGSALVSLGVIFFNQVGLLTGGTAGLALFITKVTALSFGQVFFMLNLPFYILSVTRMDAVHHQYLYCREYRFIRGRPSSPRHSDRTH